MGHRQRPRTGTPVPADPPQPPHRRPGLLPLLQPAAGHASRPRHGRRAPLDHRGELPGRQRPDRPGRAPGPPLDLLAPVGHPRHARRRSPHHRRRPRARTRPRTSRPDPADPQRDRPPALQPDHPARARHHAPDALVTLAPPPPAPRPDLPLPEANSQRPGDITIYGWSIRDRLIPRYISLVFAGGGWS